MAVVQAVKARFQAFNMALQAVNALTRGLALCGGNAPCNPCTEQEAAQGSGQGKPVHDAGHGKHNPPSISVTCCQSLVLIVVYPLQTFLFGL